MKIEQSGWLMNRVWVQSLCFVMVALCSPVSAVAQDFEESFDSFDESIWTQVDRGDLSVADGVLSMKDCYVTAGDVSWRNYAMEFRARAPDDADTVRIFAGFRFNSDQNRYVFGLRGGNNNDLFLARYGDKNQSAFLKIEPLGFIPQKGVWYTIRIEVEESGIQVFLNDEPDAKLTVSDVGAPFERGKIALGGGWSKTEFDCVKVSPLTGYEIHPNAIRYNFQSLKDAPVAGWTPVDNRRYTQEKGIGWNDDGLFTRKRNVSENPLADSLVGFSDQGSKVLRVDLPDGDYVVSVEMGDPSHRSRNRVFFMDELQPSVHAISDVGQSTLLRKSISTYNGQLRMRFELDAPKLGVSINWLAIESRKQAGERAWAKYLTTMKKDDAAEKEALRKAQRAAYQPIRIETVQNGRAVTSLNGDWLFLPDYEVGKTQPWDVSVDDTSWHVLDVPNFWTPLLSWNYIEGEG